MCSLRLVIHQRCEDLSEVLQRPECIEQGMLNELGPVVLRRTVEQCVDLAAGGFLTFDFKLADYLCKMLQPLDCSLSTEPQRLKLAHARSGNAARMQSSLRQATRACYGYEACCRWK